MESPALMLAQIAALTFQALWLSIAAYSNWRYPRTNRDSVIKVLTMELTKEDAGIYEDHRHRKIEDLSLMHRVFVVVCAVETLVAAALWASAVLMGLVLLDAATPAFAKAVAILSVTAFTSIWAAFLVGGQWFHYWVSAESPQGTHFSMLLWGLATLILLK